MSLDCTLLPYELPDLDVIDYSHTVLPLLTNCYALMEKIRKVSEGGDYPNSIDFIKDSLRPTGNVSEDFTAYIARDEEGETCYGELNKDAYGKQMRWVRVSVLLQFKDHPSVLNNPKNKAAWAYLKALPLNLRVAIHWS